MLFTNGPAVADSDKVLLKAIYTPVKGTDPEYGQVAIEKNELPHREIERFVWLIQVPMPGDSEHWRRALNAAVDRKYGSFSVTTASAEEQQKVESGEITLQQ
jgi:hypothetical protein